MKKLIVIGAAVLLLGGGGAGAFMFVGGGAEAGPEVVAEAEAAPAKPAEPIYVRMDGLTAPIMNGTHIRHYIFLNVTLEMADEAASESAIVLKPRLTDAFLREFYSKSIGHPDGGGTIDFDAVKKRLLRQARAVLGDGKVVDVLVTRAMRGAG